MSGSYKEHFMSRIIFNQQLNKIGFFIALFAIEYLATTSQSIPVVEHLWDKFNHFFAFLTLYVLLSNGFTTLKLFHKVLLLLLFGLQIEIVQSFLPQREFSLLDVVADSVGIALGVAVHKVMRYLKGTSK